MDEPKKNLADIIFHMYWRQRNTVNMYLSAFIHVFGAYCMVYIMTKCIISILGLWNY